MENLKSRIGVLILPLGMSGDDLALKYLLLHLNTVQKSFEFYLLPVFDDPMLKKLQSGESPVRLDIEAEVPTFLERYRKALSDYATGYSDYATGYTRPLFLNDPLVILTTSTFSDNYFLTGGKDWTIVAFGNWARHMAPPSIVEFFLSKVVVSAIHKACGVKSPCSHIETKGCVFDFSASLAETRFSVLSGFICAQCQKAIFDAGGEKMLLDAQVLLEKKWLGTIGAPSDVALNAKKLGYDLFHTSGIKTTWYERIRSTLEEEAIKTLLGIIATVLGASLLLWLGLKDIG